VAKNFDRQPVQPSLPLLQLLPLRLLPLRFHPLDYQSKHMHASHCLCTGPLCPLPGRRPSSDTCTDRQLLTSFAPPYLPPPNTLVGHSDAPAAVAS
jgi:hypothetical protein